MDWNFLVPALAFYFVITTVAIKEDKKKERERKKVEEKYEMEKKKKRDEEFALWKESFSVNSKLLGARIALLLFDHLAKGSTSASFSEEVKGGGVAKIPPPPH